MQWQRQRDILTVAGAVAAVLCLAACDVIPSKPRSDEERASSIVGNQVGRFVFHQGNSDYPPVMIDTVTGCTTYFAYVVDGKAGRTLQSYFTGDGTMPVRCQNAGFIVDSKLHG